ncbi:hypothetical protein FACS1894170_01530 [Planctomycetales bacterium]|nr:hypothetical protein FACS1894170_01530 [Planctomycetales bacterium]
MIYTYGTMFTRRRIQLVLDCTAWGLLLAVFSLWLLPLGIALGLVVGLLKHINPLDILRQVDKHYALQDRIVTAAELSQKASEKYSEMETLQLADAAEHFAAVKAEDISPLRFPKILVVAVIAMFLVHGINWQSVSNEWRGTSSEFSRNIEGVGEQQLQQIPEEFAALLAPLAIHGPLEKQDVLAAMSKRQGELQQSATEKMLQKNSTDKALQEISQALSKVKEFKAVSKDIQDGKYAKAAETLKKTSGENMQKMTDGERKAAAKEMQQTSKKLQEMQQPKMQKALDKLSKGLKEKDSQACKNGAEALADELSKQDARQQATQQASAELARLAEAKSLMQSGNSDGGKQTEKSKEAGKNWGSGSAKNPTAGEKTELQSKRQQQALKGQLGAAGDSEKEKTNDKNRDTAEPQQDTAKTEYQNIFPEYRKAAEAALDTEPIPLGKRQMIRNYFTAISPP